MTDSASTTIEWTDPPQQRLGFGKLVAPFGLVFVAIGEAIRDGSMTSDEIAGIVIALGVALGVWASPAGSRGPSTKDIDTVLASELNVARGELAALESRLDQTLARLEQSGGDAPHDPNDPNVPET